MSKRSHKSGPKPSSNHDGGEDEIRGCEDGAIAGRISGKDALLEERVDRRPSCGGEFEDWEGRARRG